VGAAAGRCVTSVQPPHSLTNEVAVLTSRVGQLLRPLRSRRYVDVMRVTSAPRYIDDAAYAAL